MHWRRVLASSIQILDVQHNQRCSLHTTPSGHIAAAGVPVLMVHGDKDEVIDIQHAEASAKRIEDSGSPVAFVAEEQVNHTVGNALVSSTIEALNRLREWQWVNESQWGCLPGTGCNDCVIKPARHLVCTNEQERQTSIGISRAECLGRCIASKWCAVIQFQHDVNSDSTNDWCHLYPRCTPGLYHTPSSFKWCIEVLVKKPIVTN